MVGQVLRIFTRNLILILQIISAKLNCIVLVIDPRGTGGKGWKFRSYANQKLGYWEPRDLTLVTSEYISKTKTLLIKIELHFGVGHMVVSSH